MISFLIGGDRLHSFEFPIRNMTGMPFKEAVVTSDQANIAILAADKGHREAMYIFSSKNGDLVTKIPLRYSGVKVRAYLIVMIIAIFPRPVSSPHFEHIPQDVMFLVAMPTRSNQVAMIDPDRAVIVDISGRKISRNIPRWGGMCTKDGRYGLYAPAR